MNVIAAVDLRDGAVVQLVGGDPGAERVRIPDPAAVARGWIEAGFRHLHVVDLDAAMGRGDNDAAIRAVVREARAEPGALVQVGGGIRDRAAVVRALDAGCDRVVVGTRAVEDRAWLETVAAAWPRRLVVAADVAGGLVLTRGWTAATGLDVAVFLEGLAPLPLAGALVTDVDREGRELGVDVPLFRRMVDSTQHPLMAAGGIGGIGDLEALRDIGAAGAVLGMALYTGRVRPADALTMEDTWSR